MIRIPDRQLSADTEAKLAEYQATINVEPDFARRTALAAERFKQHNSAGNRAFREVRKLLAEMCSGRRRCMYCEDSLADEVEHHKPKRFYPEEAFRWENLLYACGPCNGPKRHRFAVFDHEDGIVELRGPAATPPPAGTPLLLHPRTEDPLDFLSLDIAGDTFRFVPTPGQNARDMRRAKYTCELLKLNERDDLTRARRDIYWAHLGLLREFVQHRGHPEEEARIREAHRGFAHTTVWQEMKKQSGYLPEVQGLLQLVPEALNW